MPAFSKASSAGSSWWAAWWPPSSPGRLRGRNHTTAPTSTMASAARTMVSRREPGERLDAQLFTRHRALSELARRGLEHDRALFHDVAAIADGQRHPRVLLHEEHRHAEPFQLAHHVADVADEGR